MISADAFVSQTARLRLRPLDEADEALYCELYTDPDTMRLIGPPLSPAGASGSFRKALSLQQSDPMKLLLLVLVEPMLERSVGVVGIPKFDAHAERLEMGLMLIRRVHGKGYPREVLAHFVQLVFSLLPVKEICVEYSRENLAADRAARSVGLVRQSTVEDASGSKCFRSALRESWLPLQSDASRR